MFLGLANFLVSCEVDKAVLQESWDLDVDSWSRDSCSSLYSISLRGKKGTSGVQQAARQSGSPGTTPEPAHVKAPVSHFTEVTWRWDLRKGQVTLIVKAILQAWAQRGQLLSRNGRESVQLSPLP